MSLDLLNSLEVKYKNTVVSHLGIEFVEVTRSKLVATMPVDERTIQPLGILNGGSSVLLAETIGSVGSWLNVDQDKFVCLGMEINANHIKPAYIGDLVTGIATPIHLGRKVHIWDIEIRNKEEKLVCKSRLTVAVVPKKED